MTLAAKWAVFLPRQLEEMEGPPIGGGLKRSVDVLGAAPIFLSLPFMLVTSLVKLGEFNLYGSAAIYYFKTRPSLTGIWQVSRRSTSGKNNASPSTSIALHCIESCPFRRTLSSFSRLFPPYARRANLTDRLGGPLCIDASKGSSSWSFVSIRSTNSRGLAHL